MRSPCTATRESPWVATKSQHSQKEIKILKCIPKIKKKKRIYSTVRKKYSSKKVNIDGEIIFSFHK